MQINWIGVTAALSAFVGVWLGHVSVRKLERESLQLWKPSLTALVIGLGLEAASFLTSSRALSTMFGILGVTLLWDALEFYRQQRRIQRGHAPANPNNPRHARILAEFPTATTIDWLDRDPRGSAYTPAELASIREAGQ